MGKICVNGKAEKQCTCDIMEITLEFTSSRSRTKDALDTATAQCDRMLERLAEKGVDISRIRLDGAGIGRDRYSHDREDRINASRSITLALPFDMGDLNGLTDLIRQEDYDIVMTVEFLLSDSEAVHSQLIREAVLDSQKKAELIAQTTGQKVVGIDEVRAGNSFRNDELCEQRLMSPMCLRGGGISDSLSAPVTTHSESVEVVWLIE